MRLKPGFQKQGHVLMRITKTAWAYCFNILPLVSFSHTTGLFLCNLVKSLNYCRTAHFVRKRTDHIDTLLDILRSLKKNSFIWCIDRAANDTRGSMHVVFCVLNVPWLFVCMYMCKQREYVWYCVPLLCPDPYI